MNDMHGLLAEPTWNIAKLFHDQGSWRVEEYLACFGEGEQVADE